ncbi:hypothetical protein PUR50_25480, partial [Enterobacter hormaechei subsp. steigerwaltii]|nr:hypothetical protein [Enterobacter hormaechei subsp. steigerwaltii]
QQRAIRRMNFGVQLGDFRFFKGQFVQLRVDVHHRIEQNSGNSLVQDIGSALANKPPASDAEIQLIRSRLVLGKTVDDLDLDIAV